MAKVDLGKVAITIHGEWSSVTRYERLSLVTRSGGVYLSKRDTEGNDPLEDTQSVYWLLISRQRERRPYLSLERVRKYLYRVTFDSLPEDLGGSAPLAGACSAYVQGGKLYRNFDFYYDDAATFIVRTPDFEGVAMMTGLDDGAMDDALIAQLPYRMVDGRNNHGIMVSVHLLFNDWQYTGAGNKSIPMTSLLALVLSRVKSMDTIGDDLADVLGKVTVTAGMGDYLLQCLITDGTTTYALVPPQEDGLAYVLVDVSENPKMSNFRWVNRAEVSRYDMDMQTRPTGVERWNAMPCPLADLRFTKAYEAADRLSEFIGINETTKSSTDAELVEIYNLARAAYLTKERDGQTWQTMHSVVYGAKMEELYIQEDWTENIIAVGGTTDHAELLNRDAEDQHPVSAITGLAEALAAIAEDLAEKQDDISDIIPAQASSQNKLADRNFVNSSIQTASANFRGNWATKSVIPTDVTLYPADYAGNRKPTTNDYLVVQADESQDGGTWRYKYSGDWDTDGVNGWFAEYEVNETPLTAAQLAALNSGITENAVQKIAENTTAIAGKYTKPTSGIPETDLSDDVQSSLDKADSSLQSSDIVDNLESNDPGKALSANQGKVLKERLDAKANKDGYYVGMGVGTAENLVDTKGEGSPQEFVRRTSAGSASIAGDGAALVKKIKGNTIVWNQLIEYFDVTSIIETSSYYFLLTRLSNNISIIAGHKYIMRAYIQRTIERDNNALSLLLFTGGSTSSGGAYITIQDGAADGYAQNIFTATNTLIGNNVYISNFYGGKGFDVGDSVGVKNLNLIDLTQMFGAGNEPSTVEEFESLFPLPYYPYNAGQLLSLKADGIVTDGFNQFDGTKARVFGGKAYYINGTYTTLKFAKTIDGEQTDITPTDHLYTPTEGGYIFATGTGANFNVNLSWSGYRNAEYEPYWRETRHLPALTNFDVRYIGTDGQTHTEAGMKSAGAVYDEQTPTKDIRRIGVVDLGAMPWTLDSTRNLFYIQIQDKHGGYGAELRKSNLITPRYSSAAEGSVSSHSDEDKVIWCSNTSTYHFVYLRDSAYTSIAELKASLAGVPLFYELETPVETEVATPRNLLYRVSDFGTETLNPQGVDEQGVPMTAPFRADIKYSDDFVRQLVNMPRNYQSQESMDAMLSALGTALGFTYTKTWDATNGKWTYSIIMNS